MGEQRRFEHKLANVPRDINVGESKKMTSNANMSDSEKSVDINAPGEESVETTPEDTMDTLLAQSCNTQAKRINKRKKRDSVTVKVQMSALTFWQLSSSVGARYSKK